jgi:PAS domain S-box-containing protein
MARIQSQPERLSNAAAHGAARSRMGTFLRDGLLAGLLAFALPAAAAFAVYHLAERSRLEQARQQFQTQAEYLAALVNPKEHGLPEIPEAVDSPADRALTAPLRKAREFFPAWSQLLVGRYENDQVRFVLEVEAPGELPRNVDPADEEAHLAEALKQNSAFPESRSLLSSTSLLRTDDQVWSILVPLGDAKNPSKDFLYLETSLKPLAEELSLALDARDMALIAAGIVGLLTILIVCFWRYRTFFKEVEAMNKVKESESLFRSTYEMSPVAMYLSEINGRVIRMNRSFCQFLGYSEAELLRLRPSEYTREVKTAGQHTLSGSTGSSRQMEQCYRRQDGRLVWGLVSTAVVRDARNDVSHLLAQVVDITERKMVEETLRLSEERLALAADAGGVGMWDYDIQTGEVVWNSVMHSIHHTEAKSFAATFDKQQRFVVEAERGAFEAEFRRCMREGRPFIREYLIADKSGGTHHVKTRALFIRDSNGRLVRAVGTAIDVSVEKAEAAELIRTREAALAADKAKSEFLAIMSHEIRTPLNGVLGFTSLLKGTPLNLEQQGYLETMEASGERLINLVNDILDLSKVEAGEIRIEPVTFAIRPFLQTLHEQFRLPTDEKHLGYELAVAVSAPEMIHTDPNRLGQILGNLLGNAVKFTAKGHVRFSVHAIPKAENWEWHFSVEDTGPGIPPEVMPNLFQAFYQVDSTNTRRHSGAGLGLAISRRFAKRLNGQLVLRSEVDEGSEFTFILPTPPTEISQPEVAPSDPTDPTDQAAHLAGKRILVVEDNAVNRKLCGLQLKRLGCEMEFAETGLAAVEKARAEDFDAILMDIQLPDLDGYAVTGRIRAAENDGTHVAIIALTANAMAEDRKRCLDAGMDDFLSKPLKIRLLAETLTRWIETDPATGGKILPGRAS